MRRQFSAAQRRLLAFAAAGRCQSCGTPLTPSFHADHRRPFSAGGPTITANGQALCEACNLLKGNKMIRLRPWQAEAHDKAVDWFLDRATDRHFLIDAAPGAGKTLVSCAIAETMIKRGFVQRVVVIAPRTEVVNQWAKDFSYVTGRHMSRITGADDDFSAMKLDVCATWAATDALHDGFQELCENADVLVICDEHHHAAVKAAWGETADSAFRKAAYVLVLTGTPTRSDGKHTIFLPYADDGRVSLPDGGSYRLTYGEAVDLGYCRPVTFHRHHGRFRVDLEDGSQLTITGDQPASVPGGHPAARVLRRSVEFYKLTCVPQYDERGAARLDGFQGSMMSRAADKLDDLRERMPEAGGLVIASSIEMAEYFAELIQGLEGERPIIVHSGIPNPDAKINAFRRTDARWLVSVGMVSEGVDIPRLRVLVYLPSALTELAFRQAVGRVVRSAGPDDDTRAYVVMPSFPVFDDFARRIEAEMSPVATGMPGGNDKRKCPVCRADCDKGASACPSCGHEFPARRRTFVTCDACGMHMSPASPSCPRCGTANAQDFDLTLDEALRDGAITRGIDVSEEDLQFAEANAERVRSLVYQSGDAALIRMIRGVPEECLGLLRKILVDVD